MKPSNSLKLLDSSSHQFIPSLYGKGINTIYVDTTKKKKVEEECLYLLNLAKPWLWTIVLLSFELESSKSQTTGQF
jgi:hypothetical protein